jgi:LysM repeat protein
LKRIFVISPFLILLFVVETAFSQQDTISIIELIDTIVQSDTIAIHQSMDSTALKVFNDSIVAKREIDSLREIKYVSLDSIAEIRSRLIDSIIDYGKTFVGLKYRYGGITPAGFDCSGFVFHIHRHFNLPMPRVPNETSLMGTVVPIDSVQPGDLVYIQTRAAYDNTIGHVMMVIEKTEDSFYVIHSASHAGLVIERFHDAPYYVSRYLFSNRMPDEFYTREWNDSLLAKYRYANADIYKEYIEPSIPAEQPEGTSELIYSVKSGDAISLIASWYGVKSAEIMAWNGMGSYNLNIDQNLKIYVNEALHSNYSNVNNLTFEEKQRLAGIDTSCTGLKEEKLDPDWEYYTVKSGDNPSVIASKYPRVSSDDIMKNNGITNPSSLRIGQKLKIKKK